MLAHPARILQLLVPADGRSLVRYGARVPAVIGSQMSEGNGGIVLFDGTCGFCEGAVRFIARRDPAGYFRFAPSQWPQAQAALAAHGITRDAARSLVLIEDGQVYLRSTASLRIAARLTWPWRAARVLLWVPRPIRDAVYRVVVAIRHRLAGRSTACELPPPELRGRLLG